jgi:[acyl-carrier-protein] S-malonyltransferase
MAEFTYILCPGQGAQVVGMGKDFYGASPAAKDVFDLANRILDLDLASICFDGPQDRLNQTNISQPAIYVTSIAAFGAARAAGRVDPGATTAYAGLSLGEYTALHLAGVFSFEDGLRLVAARGKCMQQAAEASPSGMVAIMGADAGAIDRICAEARDGDVLVPANYNAPGQIVVSGSAGACERALKAAEAAGCKAVALSVAGAFHSPLMQSAAERMQIELDRVNFSPPRVPVYSNVTAQPHGDVESIKRLLVRQIVSPVKWEQTMQALIGGGEARFVELAPGRTLAGLAKRINRRLPVESLSSIESLSAA